jgi:hypothetical protein
VNPFFSHQPAVRDAFFLRRLFRKVPLPFFQRIYLQSMNTFSGIRARIGV